MPLLSFSSSAPTWRDGWMSCGSSENHPFKFGTPTVSVKGYSKKNDFGKKVQKFEKRLGGVQVAVAGLREEVQGGALVDKLRFRVVISIQLATLMVLIAMLLDVV